IHSLDELKESLESGVLEQAFGSRVAYQIRVGLDERPRALLWKAEKLAGALSDVLEGIPGVSRVTTTGSLRRKKETVGDLGFLVATSKAAPVIKRFSKFGGIKEFERTAKGTWVFQLPSGLRISLRLTTEELWGLSEILATGSAAHVAELKIFAAKH